MGFFQKVWVKTPKNPMGSKIPGYSGNPKESYGIENPGLFGKFLKI